MFRDVMFFAAMTLVLTACGGGGGGSSDTGGGGGGGDGDGDDSSSLTQQGQFKDSNVVGLQYEILGQQGVTGSIGGFDYSPNEQVSFFVGSVSLGSTTAEKVITPLDLVDNGDLDNVEVINRVRFLMMLDNDGLPENGIVISPEILVVAENWGDVDFTTQFLNDELSNEMADAVSADGGDHFLPTAIKAAGHLQSTLNCIYSGVYMGDYTGTNSGVFGFIINAINGRVTGVAYNPLDDEYTELNNLVSIGYGSAPTFESGDADKGVSFSGQFSNVDDISGDWSNNGNNGTFEGARIGSESDAIRRFTGVYRGDDIGLYSFDIDAMNAVTGMAVSLSDGQELSITGVLNGSTITAEASDGTAISAEIAPSTGTSTSIEGAWNDPVDNLSGTFSGSGCNLN